MTWLTWFFLESLPALAASLFTANFILLVIWRRGGRVRPLLIGLAVSVVLITVQGLVVTRREHAAALLKGIERDLMSAQTGRLAAALADDFQTGNLDKGQFVALVARRYETLRVCSLHCSQLEVRDCQPDQFIVETAYQADVRGDLGGGWIRSRWELTLSRAPDGWRIAAVRPLYIDGFDHPDWRALDHH